MSVKRSSVKGLKEERTDMNKKPLIPGFDLSSFQAQLIGDIKSGKPLMEQEGGLTPLIKQCLEAALEGEMNSHMAT